MNKFQIGAKVRVKERDRQGTTLPETAGTVIRVLEKLPEPMYTVLTQKNRYLIAYESEIAQ